MKILYYSPSSHGGIAEYAHEQANALVDLGAEVTLLCTPKYPAGRGEKYHLLPVLTEPNTDNLVKNKALKIFHIIKTMLSNSFRLADFIEKNDFKHVLFGTYTEYMAPLWAWRLRQLAKKGIVFGAIIHDPVRDFVVGPLWWHRWSIAEGYSFLREAFVHEPIKLDTVRPMPGLHTTVIPHGLYQYRRPLRSREEIRRALDIPQDAKVMLSFGHIHPHRKNIGLIIHAMEHFPELYLIVAGNDTSSSQNVSASYKDMANKLNVAGRCRWDIRFIPDENTGDLFEAADIMMLIYKSSFRSASGVLNLAAAYRKPCIASSGNGNLKTSVIKYGLGVWVEADSADSLTAGIKKYLEAPPKPSWEKYLAENSWGTNAELVINRMETAL